MIVLYTVPDRSVRALVRVRRPDHAHFRSRHDVLRNVEPIDGVTEHWRVVVVVKNGDR